MMVTIDYLILADELLMGSCRMTAVQQVSHPIPHVRRTYIGTYSDHE